MADLDDLSFDSGPAPPPAPRPPAAPPLWPAAGIILFLVAALAGLWYFAGRDRPPASQPKLVTQTTVTLPKRESPRVAEPGENIELPPLDQSDSVVRTLVAKLSAHPVVAAWLTTDGLVRNMAVVIANVADGETPAKHLRAIRPSGTFTVRQSGGLTVIDAASYARYDGMAAAVDGVDARGVARFYATIKPRLAEAYGELGTNDPNLDHAVERAIVTLLRTPLPADPVQVRPAKLSYEFADPSLEGLSKAQRQLLRIGPRNMRVVHNKLREIARYLGIADSSLPPDAPRS
jgi:hypothetical protein